MMKQDKNTRLRQLAVGYLDIEIIGDFAEKMLNLALQQGIELHNIRHHSSQNIEVTILLADAWRLRSLAKAARVRFKIKKRGGLPFIIRHITSHLSFFITAFLAAIALYIMFNFIWQVEIKSDDYLDANQYQQILAIAAEHGLKVGAKNSDYDPQIIKYNLQNMMPQLLFVQVHREGITAIIEIALRRDVLPEEQPEPAGDIIADFNGLITNILVHSGTAAVAIGDTVKKGDILVYGFGGANLVAASAIIEATVWAEATSTWPLVEQGQRAGINSASGLAIRFNFGDQAVKFWIYGQNQPPFALYSQAEVVYPAQIWRNMALPVELIEHTWYEQVAYRNQYSPQEALYHAERKAYQQAISALPLAHDLLNQNIINGGISADTATVKVILEASADIGAFAPLDEQRRNLYQNYLSLQQQKPIN